MFSRWIIYEPAQTAGLRSSTWITHYVFMSEMDIFLCETICLGLLTQKLQHNKSDTLFGVAVMWTFLSHWVGQITTILWHHRSAPLCLMLLWSEYCKVLTQINHPCWEWEVDLNQLNCPPKACCCEHNWRHVSFSPASLWHLDISLTPQQTGSTLKKWNISSCCLVLFVLTFLQYISIQQHYSRLLKNMFAPIHLKSLSHVRRKMGNLWKSNFSPVIGYETSSLCMKLKRSITVQAYTVPVVNHVCLALSPKRQTRWRMPALI